MKKHLYRTFNATVGEASDETIRIAISTETPYLREKLNGHPQAWEILGHAPEEVDLSYLLDGAPFFYEHEHDGIQIGVLENVSLDEDRVLRASVRFSSHPFAQQIFDDMKRGIRKRISVGYETQRLEDAGVDDNGTPYVRATRWMPFEASSVAIPADINAGTGKSKHLTELHTMDEKTKREDLAAALTEQLHALSALVDEVATMDAAPVEEAAKDVTEDEPLIGATTAEEEAKSAQDELQANAEKAKALLTALGATTQVRNMKVENGSKETVERITNLAVKHGMTDKLAGWLTTGATVEAVSAEILSTKDNTDKVIGAPAVHTKSRQNDLSSAVRAFLSGDSSELAERGIEQAREAGKSITPGTLYLPTDTPMVKASVFKRGLVRAGYGNGTGAASNATAKEYLSWQEVLTENSLLARVGGEIRTVNKIATMPYWGTEPAVANHAESGSVTTDSADVSARTINPKRIAARYQFTNLIGRLDGEYSYEQELYNALLVKSLERFEYNVFGGTGANNQTLGVTNNTEIADYSANSGSFTLTTSQGMVTALAALNANVDTCTFVLAHDVYGGAASIPAFTNGGVSLLNTLLATHQVERTGFVSKPNTPLSTAILGNFEHVTAFNVGALEISRDDITARATGQTILTAESFIDVMVRNPKQFVKWTKVIV